MGLAALSVLAIAVVLWWSRPYDATAAIIFLRSAIVLGAIWLAWPDLVRIPRWMSIGGVISMFLIARFPMLATVLLPAFAIARWVLKKR
jgi:hypothetical protein